MKNHKNPVAYNIEFKLKRIVQSYDGGLYYQCKDSEGNNWTLMDDVSEIQAWK